MKWVWELLERYINEDKIVVCQEIYEEVQDDDLEAWIRTFQSKFVGLTQEVQITAKAILKTSPGLLNLNKGKSSADPFLLAVALNLKNTGHEVIVVTEEGPREIQPNTKKRTIPNICSLHDIKVITMDALIKEIQNDDESI
jgi:hypothetical protein